MGAVLEAKSYHQGRTAFAHLVCLAQANGIPKRRGREVLDLVGLTPVAKKRVVVSRPVGPWVGYGVFWAWIAAVLAVAAFLLQQRDT